MSTSAATASLPGASLLLASISLLFSAWYGEIRDALAETRPTSVDAEKAWLARRERLRNTRARPLALAILGFVIVFAAPAIAVILSGANGVVHPSRWHDYNAPAAAVALIWCFAGGVGIHVLGLHQRLRPQRHT